MYELRRMRTEMSKEDHIIRYIIKGVYRMKRTLKQIMRDAYALLWNDIKQAKWVIIFIIAYFAFMKTLYSNVPIRAADRISLPCVRHDPGGLLPAQDGF